MVGTIDRVGSPQPGTQGQSHGRAPASNPTQASGQLPPQSDTFERMNGVTQGNPSFQTDPNRGIIANSRDAGSIIRALASGQFPTMIADIQKAQAIFDSSGGLAQNGNIDPTTGEIRPLALFSVARGSTGSMADEFRASGNMYNPVTSWAKAAVAAVTLIGYAPNAIQEMANGNSDALNNSTEEERAAQREQFFNNGQISEEGRQRLIAQGISPDQINGMNGVSSNDVQAASEILQNHPEFTQELARLAAATDGANKLEEASASAGKQLRSDNLKLASNTQPRAGGGGPNQ